MASSAADTRRERRARPTQARGSPAAGPGAPLGPTLAITLTLAVACFGIAIAVVMALTSPTPLPAFHAEENQTAESALYVIAFVLILPFALIVVPRLADRIAAGPNGPTLSLAGALMVVTLAAALILARVLPGGGDVTEELVVVCVWAAGAAALLYRLWSPRPWALALRTAHLAPAAWIAAGAGVLAAVLAFTDLGSISLVPFLVGMGLVAAGVALYARGAPVLPRVPRPWGFGVDAAMIVLLLLAVPDLVILGPGPPLGAYTNSVIQFHHDLWLGPVNEMLAGRVLLVDTAGQYGIAPLYLLAGWFEIAPIGYGTLGFFDGLLFALLFASAYCALRLAETPRLIAAGTLLFGLVVLVYNLVFSVGDLPQHGPLRFGLPMVLILAAIAEARWPGRARWARAVELAVVGLASVWALEALAYTLFTYVGLVAFRGWMRGRPGLIRWLGRQLVAVIGACLAAQVVFIVVTLAIAGALPDYGWYIAFLDAFLRGNLAELTYDFTPWSGALAVGMAYAASAAGVVLVVSRRPGLAERERVCMTALCGLTAYGIALYSYFVDRSPDHVLPYVSLPAVLAAALWLALLLRRGPAVGRSLRLGALAFTLSLGVLLVSVAWSSVRTHYDRSALAHVIPGGSSLRGALHRLWHPPPLDPAAPAGERLLDTYMPDQSRVLIIAKPDLSVEILVRSGRSNELPFSNPLEDSFVGRRELPALQRAVDDLEPGDRLLTQRGALEVLSVLRAQPSRDVLADPIPVREGFTPQQEWVLQQMAARFHPRVIDRDRQGFVVVSLAPR